LDYVNLSKEDSVKLPADDSWPSFCGYKFPDKYNGLKDCKKLKKEVYASSIAGGFKLATNTVAPIASGTNYHLACFRYRL
jgi:hypothetical protein